MWGAPQCPAWPVSVFQSVLPTCPNSVPSRLIGHRLRVRLYASEIEVEYQGQPHRALPAALRSRGLSHRFPPPHPLAHSQAGAFRRYRYREALFPTLTFRRGYDALCERSTRWADLEYVRILHLAATTMESRVETAIATLLEAEEVLEYERVKAEVAPQARRSQLQRCTWSRSISPSTDALIEREEVAV
jgi:hypothetical protein